MFLTTNINRKRHLPAYFLFLSLVAFPSFSIAAEFAVSPMIVNIDALPGETHEFSVNVYGKHKGAIKAYSYSLTQANSGHMAFTDEINTNSYGAANWISLKTKSLKIKANENKELQGHIKVPRNASGTYLAAVMIEEDQSKHAKKQISVTVRYAVILQVRVKGLKRSISKSSFENMNIITNKKGTFITALFTNQGNRDGQLKSKVQIRTKDGKLLEQVTLKTESAWQREDKGSRVYPNSTVILYGKINKPLNTNDYTLMSRNKFNDRSLPTSKSVVQHIKTEDEIQNDKPSIQTISISENTLITPKANGVSFSSIVIENTYSSPITLTLPNKPQHSSAVKSYRFYPQSIELAAGKKSKVILKQDIDLSKTYGKVTYEANYEYLGIKKSIPINTEIKL